jgi:hypothetical protein
MKDELSQRVNEYAKHFPRGGSINNGNKTVSESKKKKSTRIIRSRNASHKKTVVSFLFDQLGQHDSIKKY